MARTGHYKVKFRRRREGKTNYYRRREMIKSGLPRLVVRRTNRYIIAQVVVPRVMGDEVIVSATSKELPGFGWKGGLKDTPSAYLVGLIIGYKALLKGIKKVILDIGLHRPIKGTRIFTVLKGAIDAGLEVPHSEDILPEDDRAEGKHIAEYAEKLKGENEDLYKARFSQYLAKGLEPMDLPKHVDEVRNKIKNYYMGWFKRLNIEIPQETEE
ncbi:50S ribosomal protein L18 [Vulcanisaeta souniana]|uniref:Large ribosomal subunit protein uL18 n=1 Tax=Vulcanisaeta souniana JCM 11219 TaxID=1293586 RepID=A0A830E738_9CREN|nr:50S ribosomal protein L18 [Vulcanisaeta souniana]BDR93166.1 50S ribosomal protein L18 [Vulcanisaeta souniana JCM 11219]GGI78178.1 50S ribosomal protein L18 [Vulcanisaeta souniana JCM 11219]